VENVTPLQLGSPHMSVRSPAVAGTFYPGGAEALRRELDALIPALPRSPAAAVVVPHAGYAYSGRVAGAVYGRIEVPRNVVLLCFNHHGAGSRFAVWPAGSWRTPLGDAPIHAELAGAIRDAFPLAEFDESGHMGEHSGEVQVPFLQRIRADVRIAPVALSVGYDDRSVAQLGAFGEALAGVREEFLVVASTDLNHYEDQRTTVEKDQRVIQAIEALDAQALVRTIRTQEVSMCGFAPTLAAIAYSKAKGARNARTVVHATSGDVSGDYDRVVGYVGMVID
jgi:AmmeMemoRadiSam system protein B